MRLPRALLDPLWHACPAADAEGLVAVQLRVSEGRISALEAPGPRAGAALPLALTAPVEPHAHLDKAFSWSMHPNQAGTVAGALAANGQEHLSRTRERVLERGERALQLAWASGLRAVRSHIDSLGPAAEASWEALLELRRRWQGRIELQLVALVPIDHWATPEGTALARRVADAGERLGGVLGPGFVAPQAAAAGVLALLRLAEGLGCGVDLHVDEADSQPGAGVALVTRLVRQHGFGVPLACSHSSSLGLLGTKALERQTEAIAAAGLSVIALPLTNLWLLGRHGEATPSRRPLAPIRQLQRAGVTVAVGGDNVQDPWYPGGSLDPIELLRQSLAAAQLAPWQRLGLAPFTTAAARVLGLAWDGVVRVGAPADLVVLSAGTWGELLARPPQRRVLRAGQWLPPEPSDHPLLAGLSPLP
ncbi:amidohydrolase family protein [Cyanobium sp. Morenito 9A2]|nr:amidohydrolase family protein [Cyanobium sp. Morenito 9A2]